MSQKKIFILALLLTITLTVVAKSIDYAFNKRISDLRITPTPTQQTDIDYPRAQVFTQGLKVPWSVAFLPSGEMLVTEREGKIRLVSKDGKINNDLVAEIKVKQTSEGGLHGIALSPHFTDTSPLAKIAEKENNNIFIYYTYSEDGKNTLNRVSRFVFKDKKMIDEKVIIDSIPGSSNHDGGRIKFGPDGFLYITTGDAESPSSAQDTNTLSGKILRVTEDGDPAPGNPFANRIFSLGHRNPQGITWDTEGNLWETEHGPSGLETGNDELNKIEKGKNYGWPLIRGKQTKDGLETPVLESGKGTTWAPADLIFLNGSLFFVGLKGEALYKVSDFGSTPKLDKYLTNEYGRLREIVVGPDKMLYITTSNLDGRGKASGEGGDKILRVNPNKL